MSKIIIPKVYITYTFIIGAYNYIYSDKREVFCIFVCIFCDCRKHLAKQYIWAFDWKEQHKLGGTPLSLYIYLVVN